MVFIDFISCDYFATVDREMIDRILTIYNFCHLYALKTIHVLVKEH